MALGLAGPSLSPWLTALPALLAALSLALVAVLPRFGPGEPPGPDASRARRWLSATRKAVIDGTREAFGILRSGNLRVIARRHRLLGVRQRGALGDLHAVGLAPR